MLAEVLARGAALEIVPIVDVVVGVLGVPVWIAHGILFCQVLLWTPHLLRAVWVLLGWEWTLVLWNVHLILGHEVVQTRVLLVLEPCVGDTEIVVWVDTDGQLTWNGIPRVLVHLPDRRVTVRHLRHFIVGACWPQNLNLFALRVCDDLAADVGLVSLIEHIDTQVNYKVSVVNFFIGCETELLNTEGFTSSETWHTAKKLLNISRLWSVIPGCPHVSVQFLDVLHRPRTIVCWNGTRLTHGMNVSHVVNGRGWVRVERLDVRVDVLSRRQLLRHQV